MTSSVARRETDWQRFGLFIGTFNFKPATSG